MRWEEIDWCSLWEEYARDERGIEYWNQRASTYPRAGDYGKFILSHLDLMEDDTVLDVGAGTGRLAIPMARHVRRVIALEPAEKMVEILRNELTRHSTMNVDVLQMRWEDYSGPEVDVVVFMHSFVMKDGCDALRRALTYARRGVYIITTVRRDVFWKELYRMRTGEEYRDGMAFPLVANMLWQMGVFPDIEIVEYTGRRDFESFESIRNFALRVLGWNELSHSEIKYLERYRHDGGYTVPVRLLNAIIKIEIR